MTKNSLNNSDKPIDDLMNLSQHEAEKLQRAMEEADRPKQS